MSNGGPHGDKWSKFPVTSITTSDNILTLLNQIVEGKYASAAFQGSASDGDFLYVGYYGDDDDE